MQDENSKNLTEALESQTKRDINDFFVQEGQDAVRQFNLVVANSVPVEKYLLKQIPDIPVDEISPAIMVILEILRDKTDELKRTVLQKLMEKTHIPVEKLKLAIPKERGSSNKILSKLLKVDPQIINTDGLYVGSDVERSRIVQAVKRCFIEHDYYSFGGHLASMENDKIRCIDTAPGLQSEFNKIMECWRYKKKKGEDDKHESDDDPSPNLIYSLLPTDISRAMIAGGVSREFPEIKLLTDLPVLDVHYSPIAPGFYAPEGIYRKSESTPKCSNASVINEIFSEVPFAEDVDRDNFLAFLLTQLIHHKFPGNVPLMLIAANQRGVGKTFLAQAAAIVKEGRTSLTLTMNPNDEEMEKRICANLISGSNFVLIDNAKIAKQFSEISSSVLERSITDERVSFRKLGSNSTFTVPNYVQWALTTNDNRLSSDLVSRSVEVRLYCSGDPRKRRFKHLDFYKKVTEDRFLIIAELLEMFEIWKKVGMPLAAVQHRFGRWAQVVGGVLEANGHRRFLCSRDHFLRILDPDLADFRFLVETCLVNKFYSAKDLWEKAKSKGLFKDLAERPENGRVVAFGLKLSKFIGEKINLRESEVIFKSGGRNEKNANTFIFIPLSTATLKEANVGLELKNGASE